MKRGRAQAPRIPAEPDGRGRPAGPIARRRSRHRLSCSGLATGAPRGPGSPARRPLPFDHAHGLWQDRPPWQGGYPRCAKRGKKPAVTETACYVTYDLEEQEVRFADRVVKATVSDGPRTRLVAGTRDSTVLLLEAGASIEATTGTLPHVKGY